MSSPSPSDIGTWILVAIALIPAIRAVIAWSRGEERRITPQPLEVKAVGEMMTREACRELHVQQERYEKTRFDAIASQLSALTNSLERRNSEGETRAAKIHGRIDGVVEAVSELRGQVQNHINEHGR